jgi:heme A synthase
MADKKRAYKEMPGFEGMGKGRTAVMIVVIVVFAVAAVGLMVKGLDSAHGKVTVEPAPPR